MNYSAIKKTDIANGDGVRVSLWVSGCPIHCEGCFNKDLWDFNYGKPFTKDVTDEIIEALKPDYISGLTILGGEPMCKENRKEVEELAKTVKMIFGSTKTIWLYTGYTWQQISGYDIRRYIDVIVDGPFILAEKDISLQFRGSRNQNILRFT